MTYQIASDVRLVSLAVDVGVGIPDTDHVTVKSHVIQSAERQPGV